jgi:hypothetical protein
MSKSEEAISEQVSRLAADALAAQTRLVRESVELGREAWSPGADQAALGRAWAELVVTEGQKYWQSLAAIGLEAARDVLALNSRASAAVLRGLSEATTGRRPTGRGSEEQHRDRHDGHGHGHGHRDAHADDHDEGRDESRDEGQGPAEPGRSEAARPEAVRPVVGLTGAVGGTARGSITVVNRHPRARRVTVAVSGLRDAATDEPCAAVVGLDPAGVTIPSGQESRIELSVPLADGVFRPGHAYLGQIDVSGGDEGTIDLVVTVEGD